MNKHIYKSIIVLSVGLFASVATMAQETDAVGVAVTNSQLTRNAGHMSVTMNLDLTSLEVRSDRAAVFVPVIVNGADSVSLAAVGVYGRTRWYQSIRSGGKPLGGDDEMSYRYSERPSEIAYSGNVPYEEWMNGATLILGRYDYGCCSAQTREFSGQLDCYEQVSYTPAYHYVRPVAEGVKSRVLSGRAFVDFPVNRTELHPSYRNNSVELAKIIATIDSVRNDSDVVVTSITVKGFASPEGRYEDNRRLAEGRTEALKRYVNSLYAFESGIISTDYEPEDWEGLREYVAGSALPHKSEILRIIDDPALDPDVKDWRIKIRYGDDYKVLLNEVYPALRHSDYRIEYTIRSYDNVDAIRRIMAVSPQKLSLTEMFVLAASYDDGSEERNEIFETAVRLYPNDETANLNAANAAMERNDMRRAERCLAKAGDSAEAVYARGVFAALQGDYDKAETLMLKAQADGFADLDELIELLRKVRANDR